MLNYWGIFFMEIFVPTMLGIGGYLSYICDKTE